MQIPRTAATPSSSSESAEGKNVNPAEHPHAVLRHSARTRIRGAHLPTFRKDRRLTLMTAYLYRQHLHLAGASVLDPAPSDGETIGGLALFR